MRWNKQPEWSAIRQHLEGLRKSGERAKLYVVDTNVLCGNPDAIEILAGLKKGKPLRAPSQNGDEPNAVGLISIVERELDSVKRQDGKSASVRHCATAAQSAIEGFVRSAADANRRLDEGILLANGGLLIRFQYQDDLARQFGINPVDPDQMNADTKITLSARVMQEQLDAVADVIFVSNDIAARTQALGFGLRAETFHFETVSNLDTLYRGIRSLEVSPEAYDLFKRINRGKENSRKAKAIAATDLGIYESDLHPNEVLFLTTPGETRELSAFVGPDSQSIYGQHHFLQMTDDVQDPDWPPDNSLVSLPFNMSLQLNREQRALLNLLCDPEVQIATAIGPAGTGKTYLSVLAGLYQVQTGRYGRVIFCRSLQPVGQELGYLPGSKDEKLSHWSKPAQHVLGAMLRTKEVTLPQVEQEIARLQKNETFCVETTEHFGGLTIPNAYVIIDEAQGFERGDMEIILGRMGMQSKIVIVGDPSQVLGAHRYVTRGNNGLVHVVRESEKARDPRYAHVTLSQIVRSPIAEYAHKIFSR